MNTQLEAYLANFNGVKQARIQDVLSKRIRLDNVIYTYAEIVEKFYKNGVDFDTITLASKKVKGCYAELAKSRKEYYIYLNAVQTDCLDLNKIAYEYALNLIEVDSLFQ